MALVSPNDAAGLSNSGTGGTGDGVGAATGKPPMNKKVVYGVGAVAVLAIGAYLYAKNKSSSSSSSTPATTLVTSPTDTGTTSGGYTGSPSGGSASNWWHNQKGSTTTPAPGTIPTGLQVPPNQPVSSSIPGAVPATSLNSTASQQLIGAGAQLAPNGAIFVPGTPSEVAAAGPQPAGDNFDTVTNSYVPQGQPTYAPAEQAWEDFQASYFASNPGASPGDALNAYNAQGS